jgi:cold shock CspA family protein
MSTTAIVVWFNPTKKFGFVNIGDGEKENDVFIHATIAGDLVTELDTDSTVEIEFETSFEGGQYRKTATELLSVKPPVLTEMLGVVKWYDKVGAKGVLTLDDAEAFIPGGVAKTAGVVPGPGMPMKALVKQRVGGTQAVVSFTWGQEVHDEWLALQASEKKPAANKAQPKAKAKPSAAKAKTADDATVAPKPKVVRTRPKKPALTTAAPEAVIVQPKGVVAAAVPAAASEETAMSAAFGNASS